MYRFVRDSFVGRIVYHASSHRFFSHKEESDTYVIPEKYLSKSGEHTQASSSTNNEDLEKEISSEAKSESDSFSSDQIIVTWDGDDDPDNPQNWPLSHKMFFIFEIDLLTISVYSAAAMYSPGVEDIMNDFQVSKVLATLPLTLFVIGYGVGPMVLSPLTENSIFGRTSIYICTMVIFCILQIPTALSKDIASLSVLRFLGGFFASPALATGGGSVGDIISISYMPVGIGAWCVAQVCGPSLGPFIGSIFVQLVDWRWTFWFMTILSGTALLILSCFLPETYGPTLLARKAKRLRAKTGNPNIVSEGEIYNLKLKLNEILIDALWRPIEISISEPVVLLINIYLSLIYAIMYLWYEAFPILYTNTFHFNTIETGATYISTLIGVVIAGSIYLPYIYQIYTKTLLRNEQVTPEVFLPLSIVGSILMPIGMFIFAWSGTTKVHWIGSLIGSTVFACGAFFIFQTLFNYLGKSFWRYLASVFAGNNLFRGVIAGVFPLFGNAVFNNLGSKEFPVGWGTSVLGFISVGMIAIPVLFYLNGPKLRARSKYAGDE